MPNKKKPKGMLEDERLSKEQMDIPPLSQNQEALNWYLTRLNRARDERSMERKEYDGMYFEQDYERNKETSYSYLRPKLNDDDVRVNSGTAEKKIELLHNELIAMNFQPEVRAYDQNDVELADLSADLTDIVRKTNEQETDEDLWDEVYGDLLTQRLACVEECMDYKNQKRVYTGDMTGEDFLIARKKRLSALQVYFADMNIPPHRLNEQPYVVFYDRMLFDEAKVLWGDNPNWKYVKPGSGIHEEYIPWFKYRFSALQPYECEIITYMSSAEHEDECQVIINGVMMFEPQTPMTVRTGYGFTVAAAKEISDFAHGKPPIASAKFLQSFSDETFRNVIVKFRQGIRPPLGVGNGKTYSRDIWAPGAMTQGLTSSNFTKLVEHDGVNPSEFQFMQLIKQMTEEFIGAASMQNVPGSDKMTATQVIELQKQMFKMLGGLTLSIIRLKRECTYLRLNSIFAKYLNPIEQTIKDGKVEKKYRMFEIEDGKDRDGQTVKKYIHFVENNLSKAQMKLLRAYEDKKSEQTGKPVRYSFINVNILKMLRLNFRVGVVPERRDSGQLDKVMFQDSIAQAAQISQLTGRQINADKIIQDYESTWKSHGMFTNPAGGSQGPNPAVNEKGQELLKKIGDLQSPAAAQMAPTMASMVQAPV